MKTLWLAIALSLTLSACISVTKMGPGDVVIRDQLVARLDSAWNKVDLPGAGNSEYWTTDGLSLDSLIFYPAIADGTPLAELAGRQEKQQPRFRANMAPNEIVELYAALASDGGNQFTMNKLAPATFLGGNGFRFEFTLLRKGDEVELKGIGYGAVRDGKLYLMAFRAPKIHYYAKHLPRVEAVVFTLALRNRG